MTLNAKIGVLWIFFSDFGLRHRLQERIAPKSIEIDMEKLRMKFSALNVDFDGPSLDFLGYKIKGFIDFCDFRLYRTLQK